MQCMGAQMHGCTKKGEGVHWLALACTDLILCAHDLILCYGWYLIFTVKIYSKIGFTYIP